jgi:hypothetical protein
LTYPSYLGELVTAGLHLGYRPTDFGLEQVFVGGEVVTQELKVRCQELFGPVRFVESYGMTEPWPFGGTRCEQGHLHFEVAHGLLEVLSLETGVPACSGEPGVIVATPFPPFRETTLLLRYDTQDVVRLLAEPLACSLRNLPATSAILGKRCLAIQHERGWIFPRQIVEALEAVRAVPLPARYGFWSVPGGVAVEVLVVADNPDVRRAIVHSLEEQQVPLCALHLITNRGQLRWPMPLRCDLRELSFDASPAWPPAAGLTLDASV